MSGALRAALVLALALLIPGLASAQATRVSVESPMLPLARPGAWTPIHVDIAATEPLSGEIRVDFGSSAVPAAVRSFEVGRGSAKRVSVPVVMPAWVREINVTVTRGRGRILAKQTLWHSAYASSADAFHVALIGEDPLGLPMLQEIAGAPIIGHPDCTEPRSVRVETLLPAQLPDTWFGWTGADLVVWRRPDPAQLTPEQQAALKGWVLSGGTLVVALGDTWRSWDGSPLGALSGATPSSAPPTQAIPETLAFYTGASLPSAVPAVPAVALQPTTAVPRMWADELQEVPVLVDHWTGAGRVVTMGWDPAAGELKGLLVREDMWRALLDLPSPGARSRVALAGPPFLSGSITDCGPGRQDDTTAADLLDSSEYGEYQEDEYGGFGSNAQTVRAEWRHGLQAGLSAFERANPLPLGFVLIFGLVYLLLIGPVDYLVLKKLRRPMLTWLTFPVMAIGFSVGAAILISFRKAGDTEIRCVEVVDVFADQATARGSGWCAMWSSRRQSVLIEPGRGAGVVLPGGSDNSDDPLGAGAQHLVQPTRASLGFQAAQWAVSSWHDGWIDALQGGLVARAGDGEIVVSNRTGIDLDAAWIVYGGSAWPLGPLPSGGTASIQDEPESWTMRLLGDPSPGDALWNHAAWWNTWERLEAPWDEHVAPLYVSARAHPTLIGLARGGVAPPLPADNPFVTSAHALVRAPLLDLDPEALP